MKLLVTGGYFDHSGECWVRLVDFAAERADDWLTWTPPEHLHVPTKGFTGGCLDESTGHLYVAFYAGVARVDLHSASVNGVLHHPSFNDLHHVALDRDRLLVANTGGNAVEAFDKAGRFAGAWTLTPGWVQRRVESGSRPLSWDAALDSGWSPRLAEPWPDERERRGSPSGTPFWRRKVGDRLHVNHLLPAPDGGIIATCLHDGSLRDLSRHELVAQLPESHLHDGVWVDDRIWVTRIDGTVWSIDHRTREFHQVLDAAAEGQTGWCRGLHVTSDAIVLGTTESRRGYLPRLPWVDRAAPGDRTGVGLFDRGSGNRISWIDLTDQNRHSKIFSVLQLPLSGSGSTERLKR